MKSAVYVVMRGQARREVQCPVTENGGDWKLEVDVKRKMEEVGKRCARGRKKTRVVANKDGESIQGCRLDG